MTEDEKRAETWGKSPEGKTAIKEELVRVHEKQNRRRAKDRDAMQRLEKENTIYR